MPAIGGVDGARGADLAAERNVARAVVGERAGSHLQQIIALAQHILRYRQILDLALRLIVVVCKGIPVIPEIVLPLESRILFEQRLEVDARLVGILLELFHRRFKVGNCAVDLDLRTVCEGFLRTAECRYKEVPRLRFVVLLRKRPGVVHCALQFCGIALYPVDGGDKGIPTGTDGHAGRLPNCFHCGHAGKRSAHSDAVTGKNLIGAGGGEDELCGRAHRDGDFKQGCPVVLQFPGGGDFPAGSHRLGADPLEPACELGMDHKRLGAILKVADACKPFEEPLVIGAEEIVVFRTRGVFIALPGGGCALLEPVAPARVGGLGEDAVGDVGVSVVAEYREEELGADHAGVKMIALLFDVFDQVVEHPLLVLLRNQAECERHKLGGLAETGAFAGVCPVGSLVDLFFRLVEFRVERGVDLFHCGAVLCCVVGFAQSVCNVRHRLQRLVDIAGAADARALRRCGVSAHIGVCAARRGDPVGKLSVAPHPTVALDLGDREGHELSHAVIL